MKKFLAVFVGTAESFEKFTKLTAAEQSKIKNEGTAAWKHWAKTFESSIVDGGTPLGKTKRVTKNGVADVRNEMGAFTIVHAESHDAAAAMFKDHPHFTIFPGDGVEIMECLPMPTG